MCIRDRTITYVNIYSEGLYVGNHPQTQMGLTARYQISKVFDIGGQYLYNAKLYSDYDVSDRDDPGASNFQPYQMDNYGVMDLRAGARFNIGNVGAYFMVQCYNLLDKIYWSRGIDDNGVDFAEGFTGWGRTTNFSLKLDF